MSPRLSLSLSEGMATLVREQAELECRSVSNMLERLVVLGLDSVVTELDSPDRGGVLPSTLSRSQSTTPADLLATNKSSGLPEGE